MKNLTPWILAAALLIPAASPTFAASGKALYDKHCNMCHKRISDKSFKNKPVADLVKVAIKGIKGKMPPRGASHLSDAEMKAAVEYMISK